WKRGSLKGKSVGHRISSHAKACESRRARAASPSLAHLHRDLPQLFPLVETLERRSRFLEREDPIHDRPQLAAPQQLDDLSIRGAVPHRRTQDAPAVPKQ